MTKYRDLLIEQHGRDIGGIAGCALDRLRREPAYFEVNAAVDFTKRYRKVFSELKWPISTKRQAVHDYIASGGRIPDYMTVN